MTTREPIKDVVAGGHKLPKPALVELAFVE
jgi:hypothetical protein